MSPKVTAREPWQMTADYYNEYEHPSAKKPIAEIRQELINEMERRRKESPDKLPHELRQNFRPEKYFASWSESNLRDWHSTVVASDVSHRKLVKRALSEGKPVLAEVLKDYPDLKPSAEVTDEIVANLGGVEKVKTRKLISGRSRRKSKVSPSKARKVRTLSTLQGRRASTLRR